MLETADLCALTGVPISTFIEWVAKGVVVPTVRGKVGPGCGHRFDTMRALGVVVAGAVYRSERGCVAPYVTMVVETFAGTREADLREMFRKGRTHFAELGDGRPCLQGAKNGPVYDCPNVKELLAALRARLEEKAKK
jgi:hypothetical protein